MCVVSNVHDSWRERWLPVYPQVAPPTIVPQTGTGWIKAPAVVLDDEEMEKLHQAVHELADLVKAARKVDAFLGDEDCATENQAKTAFARQVCEILGLDFDEVLG